MEVTHMKHKKLFLALSLLIILSGQIFSRGGFRGGGRAAFRGGYNHGWGHRSWGYRSVGVGLGLGLAGLYYYPWFAYPQDFYDRPYDYVESFNSSELLDRINQLENEVERLRLEKANDETINRHKKTIETLNNRVKELESQKI